MVFAKVEKRVRTPGGGVSGTVRNLRIREDTAKYLFNLDPSSAHYDPKSRSMREDPLPEEENENEKFYEGDNQCIGTGLAREVQQLHKYAGEASERGQDINIQAGPTQAELVFKSYKAEQEKLMAKKKDFLMEKYGIVASEETAPRELLLGQCEVQIEYDCVGRIIGQQEMLIPKSKYEEDSIVNNHTSVWGSWWGSHKWGYKCCRQMIRNTYCTGAAGIEAAEAATDLMKANITHKQATKEKPASTQDMKKKIATRGSDVPEENLSLEKEQLKVYERSKEGRERKKLKLH